MDTGRPHDDVSRDGSGPPTLLGARRRWEDPPGPPPPLARGAARLYAAVGLALAVPAVLRLLRDETNVLLGSAFFLGVAAYCAALAWGASRLRSASATHAASPLVCLPLLLHGLAGAAGAAAVVADGLEVRLGPWVDPALGIAMLGMLFGWVLALVPFLFARRGGVLLLAAFAGPSYLTWWF